jgi:hypothetical protein
MADGLNFVEKGFDYIGLMRGPYAPVKRAALCALIGTGLVCYFQPSSMFIDGVPRPWSAITRNPKQSAIPPTSFPWFAIPAGAALLAGVFV